MQVSVGGGGIPFTLVLLLVSTSLLAGCTNTPEPDEIEIPEGEGLVTIWMSRPDNAAEYGVQQLTAVPRFVAFSPADAETIVRTNATGYVDVAKGWDQKPEGWGEFEWPQSAEKDWLVSHDVWFQSTIPAGNYSDIRFEIIDRNIVIDNAQPHLLIGSDQESFTGHPRITFQPASGQEAFQVEEGEELVLNFKSTMEIQRDGRIMVR